MFVAACVPLTVCLAGIIRGAPPHPTATVAQLTAQLTSQLMSESEADSLPGGSPSGQRLGSSMWTCTTTPRRVERRETRCAIQRPMSDPSSGTRQTAIGKGQPTRRARSQRDREGNGSKRMSEEKASGAGPSARLARDPSRERGETLRAICFPSLARGAGKRRARGARRGTHRREETLARATTGASAAVDTVRAAILMSRVRYECASSRAESASSLRRSTSPAATQNARDWLRAVDAECRVD